MAHGSHPHHHHAHQTPDGATRNIGLAFWLNLLFAAVELVGGYYTQSLAVISDALHDFGDALSLGVGYVLQKKSTQGPSENFSYGLRRLSLLSAFISGLVISVGAVYIAKEAIESFNQPHEPNSLGMMGLAVLGISVNGFAAWRMSSGQTQNEKMLRWHLIEDLLGWIAVMVGSIFIWAFEWNWMDPVLALAISIFVLVNVLRNLASTISLFLQANPNPEGLRAFRTQVAAMPNVVEIHDVHFWSLDGVRHILSLHAVLRDLSKSEADKEHIRNLSRLLGDCHCTVEIESEDEHCHDDCEHGEEKHDHGEHKDHK
ncbi:MAG: cation transporter [Bdellovibrionales bacterium]|nr:cation transporter [Bdellovibrionales bacterium]